MHWGGWLPRHERYEQVRTAHQPPEQSEHPGLLDDTYEWFFSYVDYVLYVGRVIVSRFCRVYAKGIPTSKIASQGSGRFSIGSRFGDLGWKF